MQYTWATRPRGFALVLVPVYFIKHSVSCYIYYIRLRSPEGELPVYCIKHEISHAIIIYHDDPLPTV